jgi:DNA-directed RNA polymerase specialized sigma24 family protein
LKTNLYKDPYSDEEIKVLVEEYQELNGLRSKSFFRVRLMDIDDAITHLRLKERQAIFLCGIVGLTERTAGALLGVSHVAMHKRYRSGLVSLARYLNGG